MNTNRTLVVCLLVLFLCVRGFADGCYFPERAIQAIPAIPTQRALLVWRDGVETLIVSSELDSKAQQLGWIIPLPAVPTEMSKASPGLLKTLTFCCQPRITHDLFRPARYVALLLVLELLLLLTWRFQRRHLGKVFALLFVLLLLGGMLLPALGGHRGGPSTVAGVVMEKSARVGDYQISVVRATAATALNEWLAANGCAELPPAAGPVVAAYIKEGWVFVATRLVREETGRNTPHPLRFRFAAAEAVYPMRLTALAGGAPRLEIFVVGVNRAQSAWLRTEFCDLLQVQPGILTTSSTGGIHKLPARFRGLATNSWISHAGVTDLLWNGAVLTKLSGTVPAAQMTTDLPLRWEPFAAHQDHWYTREGAAWTALIFVLLLAGIGLLVGVPLSKRRRLCGAGWRDCAAKVLFPALGVLVVGGGTLFLALPKIAETAVQTVRSRWWWAAYDETLRHVNAAIEREPELCRLEPDAVGAALVQRLAAKKYPNPILGGAVLYEDSPGNITVRKEGKVLVVTTYDMYGQAYSHGYPLNGPAFHAPWGGP